MTTVEPIRDLKTIKKIEQNLKLNDCRNYVLFLMGINSGLRISDLLKLNVCDVKNKVYIRLIEQKTGKTKCFLMNTKLRQIIKSFIKNRAINEPLFMSKYKNRLDRIAAYKIICKVCKDAGMEENIGTHTLRKTFGYHFYKKYKDVAMLQKIFNHSSPAITMKYIGIAQEEIYNCYKNFIL